jgi:hypothetical protein
MFGGTAMTKKEMEQRIIALEAQVLILNSMLASKTYPPGVYKPLLPELPYWESPFRYGPTCESGHGLG